MLDPDISGLFLSASNGVGGGWSGEYKIYLGEAP